MDFNSTVDLIIRDLNEARDIIDDLRNYPGVPAIQVELAKAKCKNAADVIALLKTIKSEGSTIQQVKPEIQQKPVYVPEVQKAEQNTEPGIKHPPEPVADQHESNEVHHSIIADRFSSQSTSLNEQLGSARDERDVSGTIVSKPVTKLSEAIGVNDKFLFIREIFNGSPESYEQALSAVESAGGFSEARDIILGRDGIQGDSDAVKQLLSLVKRKFPSDE